MQGQRSGIARKSDEHQANAGEQGSSVELSQPGEPAEQEADASGDRIAENLHDKGGEGGEQHDGGGETEKPREEAPAIAAKLKPGALQLARKNAAIAAPQTAKPAAPTTGKAEKQAVPFDMSGKPHTLEATPAPDGVKLTVNKTPIMGKVRQALETAEVKAAQGDKKGKATGPTEIVALREVLTQLEALGTQKNIATEQLKTQAHTIADKLTYIALMTGWKSLDDAGQTLTHAKK